MYLNPGEKRNLTILLYKCDQNIPTKNVDLHNVKLNKKPLAGNIFEVESPNFSDDDYIGEEEEGCSCGLLNKWASMPPSAGNKVAKRKIIGGQLYQPNLFPWLTYLVSIFQENNSGKKYVGSHCGGTLISDR